MRYYAFVMRTKIHNKKGISCIIFVFAGLFVLTNIAVCDFLDYGCFSFRRIAPESLSIWLILIVLYVILQPSFNNRRVSLFYFVVSFICFFLFFSCYSAFNSFLYYSLLLVFLVLCYLHYGLQVHILFSITRIIDRN